MTSLTQLPLIVVPDTPSPINDMAPISRVFCPARKMRFAMMRLLPETARGPFVRAAIPQRLLSVMLLPLMVMLLPVLTTTPPAEASILPGCSIVQFNTWLSDG